MNDAVQDASSAVNFPPRLLRAGKSDIQGETTSSRWPGFSSSHRNKPSRHSVMSRVGEAAEPVDEPCAHCGASRSESETE